MVISSAQYSPDSMASHISKASFFPYIENHATPIQQATAVPMAKYGVLIGGGGGDRYNGGGME